MYDADTKFRRLLTYHKAVGEVKHIQNIKERLLSDNKPQLVNTSTNTDTDMLHKSTNTETKIVVSGTSSDKESDLVRIAASKDNALQQNPDPKLMNFIRNRSNNPAVDNSRNTNESSL